MRWLIGLAVWIALSLMLAPLIGRAISFRDGPPKKRRPF